MAEIRPFRGIRYNPQLVGDLASVICPPYDIITPQLAQQLHHRSQYNFVQIEHGWQSPGDTNEDNRYTRSAAILNQWLSQGVLKTDALPAIYLHHHYFSYGGKEFQRRSIIAGVRLEEWDRMVVRPHEGTLAEPKGDRLNLLWALEANTSPILTLFDDPEQQVSGLLSPSEEEPPLISLSNADEGRHNLWAITEPRVIVGIQASLANSPLYIADGHHRYESALNYKRERQACSPSVSGDEEFNFVMTELVDFADPGLIILSPHRLVRGISRTTLGEFETRLKSLFRIEKLSLDTPDVWQRVDDLLAGKGTNPVSCVLFGLSPGELLALRISNLEAISQMIPYFHGKLYKRLDVSIVDHVILEKLLGLSSGREEASLDFSYDKVDAVNRVLDQEYQLAFLLSPIRAEIIKTIADVGDRMPRKSTYFYPKPPSGLIIHRLR
ncbi:MAG: DUF1015 domain-containing protein [Dehalococcoidales bacterium]|nr:DUF1015 domain-containing protein [Dehalococcoidales bacterium]